ncbi:hypothetical protein F8568_029310 [Actinomadura sp. LD22]|uniref:Uncharacterized protein n=1 Tax=Actinomadura physcomitrii TaxID=2650748 RepID=A0A6I4MFF0_9ACTN|nr:hypothetical protein [Actinomadura physcomitrii]MWA04403.1 hypothetical protein [Actinomadura physcomitrii]
MTGDLGSDAGRARPRPSFLPPEGGPPDTVPAAYGPPPAPPAADPRRTGWDFAVIAASALLVVSAFLPWAHAQTVIDLFGRSLVRDQGSVAGIDADNLVLAVPVLAVVAIVMAFWNLVARDPRIGALAAVPAILSLVTCGIFVLRLGHVPDRLPDYGLNLTYQVSLRYGWFLAVAMSLLLAVFSLVRPVSDRLAARDGQRPGTEHEYAAQQYAEQQRYWAEQGAAWPEEAQAWGQAPQQGPAWSRPEEETPPSSRPAEDAETPNGAPEKAEAPERGAEEARPNPGQS